MRTALPIFASIVLAAAGAVAAGVPGSYADALGLWSQTKDKPEYDAYLKEFVQFVNYAHLDEKNACYRMPSGNVELMVVITRTEASDFATVERVFAARETPKSNCFKGAFQGVRTKVPPYLPFVVKMQFG